MRLSVPGFLHVGKIKFLFSRLLIALFVLIALSLLTASSASAQETDKISSLQNQNVVFSNNNPDVPKDFSVYTQNVLISFMGALGCQLAGINPATIDHKCLGLDNKTGKYGYVNYNGGVIGFTTHMISMLYTPPVHTSDYFRYLAGNFGVAKNAYAQGYGVGLESLHPISGLFVKFRNITYFIFVVIFIFIGLGIMLRLRIDPRTVMTIQNQIPRIIIGIILITLSFAISGLMVDLMWVLIFVVINTLKDVHPALSTAIGASANVYNTPFSLSGVVGGFLGIANDTAGSVGSTFNSIFNPNTVSSSIQLPTGQDYVCSGIDIGCLFNSIAGNIAGWIVGAFATLLSIVVLIAAWLVIVIAVIVSLFRLWFVLLKAYIMALFDIIFAPFWIIAGLIPGAGPSVGFSAWLKDLASNLLPFPAIIGLFLIARIIADGLTTVNSDNFFFPPLIGGGGSGINLGAVIAFGIIVASPGIVGMIKSALKAPGINAGFGGVGAGIAALGIVGGAAKRRLYWRDRDNNARGLAARLGQGASRSFSNSRVVRKATSPFKGISSGAGSLMDKTKLTKTAKNVVLAPKRWANEELSPLVGTEAYRKATSGEKSLTQQREEENARAQSAAATAKKVEQEGFAKSLADVIKSSGGQTGKSGQGNAPETINAQNVSVQGSSVNMPQSAPPSKGGTTTGGWTETDSGIITPPDKDTKK